MPRTVNVLVKNPIPSQCQMSNVIVTFLDFKVKEKKNLDFSMKETEKKFHKTKQQMLNDWKLE